jgi:hypothetical protein
MIGPGKYDDILTQVRMITQLHKLADEVTSGYGMPVGNHLKTSR